MTIFLGRCEATPTCPNRALVRVSLIGSPDSEVRCCWKHQSTVAKGYMRIGSRLLLARIDR